jgi:predicted permease
MFALADPFLWRPLPYHDAARLMLLEIGEVHRVLTKETPVPTLDDWRARTDLFHDVAAIGSTSIMRLDRSDGALALRALEVSENFFRVLGVNTQWTTAWLEDPGPGRERVALLRQERAGHTSAIPVGGIGLRIQSGGTAEVLGVLPPSFAIPSDRYTLFEPPDALVRFEPGPIVEISRWSQEGTPTSSSPLLVIARVRDGVTPAVLQAALAVPLPSGGRIPVTATPIRDVMTARLRPLAIGAFAAGLLILVICAANVANLLIAQGVFRERDLATRQALGATAWDLARLVLLETFLLAAGGVMGGIGITAIALAASETVMPVQFTALGLPAITPRVIGFAGAMTMVVMTAGLAALHAVRRVTPRTLVTQRASSEGHEARRVRFAMAAAQTAVAMVLIAGAVFLLRSYGNLRGQEVGYGPSVVAISVSYADDLQGEALKSRIDAAIEELRRIPGLARPAAATGAMVDDRVSGTILFPQNAKPGMVDVKEITSDYLETSGLSLVAGRTLVGTDPPDETVLVNESANRRYWPDRSAVGQQVRLGSGPVYVVGIVQDTFDRALDTPPPPMVYRALESPRSGWVTYVVQTDRSGTDVQLLARQLFARLDPTAVVTDASRMRDRLAHSVRDRSFATLVLGFFATAGVAVSATGIVALILFVVARRTKEVAIRVALGATPAAILWLVVRDTALASGFGVAIGLVAGYWLSRVLESMLYDVPAGDVTTMAIAAVVMSLAATVAALVPARRATGLQPSEALRVE